jgi:hypothetical protein
MMAGMDTRVSMAIRRFKPIRNLAKTFFSYCLGHARIHTGVFVRLTCNRCFEHLLNVSNCFVSCGVAHSLQVVRVAMGVAGFAFSGVTEQPGDIRIAFDVCMFCEVQIAAIGSRFSSKGSF